MAMFEDCLTLVKLMLNVNEEIKVSFLSLYFDQHFKCDGKGKTRPFLFRIIFCVKPIFTCGIFGWFKII